MDNPTSKDKYNSGRVSKFFRKEIAALETQIDHVGSSAASNSERSHALDRCSAGIAQLSREVQDAAATIPAYDHKTYIEAINSLTNKLSKTRAVVAPRPRFQFKTRPTKPGASVLQPLKNNSFNGGDNPSQASSNQQQDRSEQKHKQPSSVLQISEVSNEKVYQFSQATDSTLPFFDQADISATRHSVIILRLRGSQADEDNKNRDAVILSTPSNHDQTSTNNTFSDIPHSTHASIDTEISTPLETSSSLKTLRLRNIHKSLIIICNPVAGAVYISDVHTSTLALAGCQQLRMHRCTDVKAYVESTTAPVIEECTGMGFARWPLESTNRNMLATSSNESSNAVAELGDAWKHRVVDFSDPVASTGSSDMLLSQSESTKPQLGSNWYVMQPDKCVDEEVWRRLIAAAPEEEGRAGDNDWSTQKLLKLFDIVDDSNGGGEITAVGL